MVYSFLFFMNEKAAFLGSTSHSADHCYELASVVDGRAYCCN